MFTSIIRKFVFKIKSPKKGNLFPQLFNPINSLNTTNLTTQTQNLYHYHQFNQISNFNKLFPSKQKNSIFSLFTNHIKNFNHGKFLSVSLFSGGYQTFLTQNQNIVECKKKDDTSPVEKYYINGCAANDPFEDRYATFTSENHGSLFGVFDGHSGSAASEFAKHTLLPFIATHLQEIRTEKNGGKFKNDSEIPIKIEKAFLECDSSFLNGALQRAKQGDIEALAGSTSVVAFVLPRKLSSEGKDTLFVANAGDSRAILISEEKKKDGNIQYIATPLSNDHTPELPSEAERLRKEHPDEPDVVKRGRVKGYLQPSRGIGDALYKSSLFNEIFRKRSQFWNPPYTTALPEVSKTTLEPSHKYLILGTDGLWDFLSNEEVAEKIKSYSDFLSKEKKDENLSTLLIADTLKVAQEDAGRSNFDEILKLNPNQRRRIYDDITILVVKLQVD